MAIVYGLKVNLSVAMVIMVNSTHYKLESYKEQIKTLHCNDSLTLTNLPPANKSYCNEIRTNLTDLETKKFTESELNEVNMPECTPSDRNRASNRLQKMSKPFS